MTSVAAVAPLRWVGAVGWVVMAVFSLGIAAYGLSYLAGRAAPPVVEDNGMGMQTLVVHASAAGVALLIGPLQFLSVVRRNTLLHRSIGYTYLGACFVAGVAGGLLAPFTAAGPIAASGFGLLALVWLWTNAMGLRAAARKHDYAEHKRWMVRSFSLTFAAVTLRLYLIPPQIAGMDFVDSYQWIAWLSWVPNLLIAELWLTTRRAPRPQQGSAT